MDIAKYRLVRSKIESSNLKCFGINFESGRRARVLSDPAVLDHWKMMDVFEVSVDGAEWDEDEEEDADA